MQREIWKFVTPFGLNAKRRIRLISEARKKFYSHFTILKIIYNLENVDRKNFLFLLLLFSRIIQN